ncbi:hypothetical protein [Paractinoplanes maris]|uniref:hypothetical protein n=1 Tax=Paractinoplanes maris TaxID=1734446 RepID=UPI0020220448|nr:hypothetical protein [Actinoplanes maris]
MTFKPIETHYAGCRFRSRLEARWAVFLDHLDIRWEYEPQGYTLPSGANYLPDFWLPGLGLHVEVKGREADFALDAPRYAEAIHSRSLPGDGLIILGPVPDASKRVPTHLVLVAEESQSGDLLLCWHVALFDMIAGEDPIPAKEIGLPCTDRQSLDPFAVPTLGKLEKSYSGFIGGGTMPKEWPVEPKVGAAYRAARSARFERGERG